MNMTVIIVIVALVVVAGIALFVLKGKKSPPPAATPQPKPAQPQARPVSQPEAKKLPEAQPVKAPEPVKAEPVTKVAAAPTPTPAPQQPMTEPAKDPLDEAQAFIAMERFPQAVGVLSKAIDKDSKRAVLYVLLLSIYQQQNARAEFDALYGRLQSLNDTDAMHQADQLLAQFAPEKPAVPDDAPLAFTPGLMPAPAESIAPPPAVIDTDPLEFTFEKPISDGASPALQLDQSDERAFRLDTPEAKTSIDSLDALEAEFKTSGIRPALDIDLTPHESVELTSPATPEPLTDLTFDLTPPTPVTPTPKATHVDTVVDLDFNLEDSFELADDKPVIKTEKADNWAEGFADQDFSLPSAATTSETINSGLSLDDLSAATPALSDKASEFDAMLEPNAQGQADGSLDSQLAAEFAFLNERDEQQINLDLARSYADLGEKSSAIELLDDVIAHGNDSQQSDARQLRASLA